MGSIVDVDVDWIDHIIFNRSNRDQFLALAVFALPYSLALPTQTHSFVQRTS